ncbi:MAG: nucleotidyl transferase AbiEii/AbiGii toxin family protein [Bacteroidota bacterium]
MKNPNNKFPDSFREFLTELNQFNVEYLLIGGFAMGAYGHMRATNDLDIFINATGENAQRMLKACKSYGIPAESLEEEMFLLPKMVVIGQPPIKIEILKKLDIIDFTYAYERAKIVEVDNVLIKVVSLEDLILLKQAAVKGRDKSRDSEDLSFLQKLKNSIRGNS